MVDPFACPQCDGEGEILLTFENGQEWRECPTCHGEGRAE
jgi:DnaJ-class molecular chaperone